MKLPDLLSKYQDRLGPKCQHLGKVKDSFLPTYQYLSYNKVRGWDLVTLNFMQKFFRDYFNRYQETHFKTIYAKWEEFQPKFSPNSRLLYPTLDEKIKSIWQKKHIHL